MTNARRLKRQEDSALKVFNELWNEFIEFEATNGYEIGGYVHYQSEVSDKILSLHKRWKHYVRSKNANPKAMNFRYMAFKEKMESYILEKDKQVWISYTMKKAFDLYGFKAPLKDFEEMYSKELLPVAAIKQMIYKTPAMLTINLAYHRYIGKYSKEVQFPESFAELTRKQFNSFIELSGKGYTDYELKLQFLRKHFFKLPIHRINALKRFAKKERSESLQKAYYDGWLDNSSELHQLIKLLAFLNEPVNYTDNPVPKFRHLVGPKDGLKNISIWEFAQAEKCMIDFGYHNHISDLNKFTGILMRPVSIPRWIRSKFTYTHDTRIDFHDELIDKRAKAASKLPEHKKYALLAFFRSVHESLPEMFPHVYSKTQSSKKEKDGNWGDVIISMSGEIPGNEEKVAEVNLFTFLMRLDKMIEAQEEAKAKAESNK